jgi:hypothetical protein
MAATFWYRARLHSWMEDQDDGTLAFVERSDGGAIRGGCGQAIARSSLDSRTMLLARDGTWLIGASMHVFAAG